MFSLLVDTCVWLDLAKDPDQQPLLAVVQELIQLKELRLIVPRTVLTEFSQNKARVIQESGRGLSSAFKRAKYAIDKFGDPKKKRVALSQLNDIDHRLPTLGDAVSESAQRIETLLTSSPIIEITGDVKARAAQRAIDGSAPFHRQRNSIADAILIEAYSDYVRDNAGKGERFSFVTHNVKDFSDPAGNNKSPHPDLRHLFSRIKSLYFITLGEAVKRIRPALVSDLMLEHEAWVEQPRSLTEIVAAIDELCDKVWYNRHKVWEEKVQNGTIKLVDKETFPVKDHLRRPIQRDVWAGALKAAKRKEKQYGRANLGPWDDFEWGMLNGKLSALRWALGDEWDMLDT
jgi:PIN domain